MYIKSLIFPLLIALAISGCGGSGSDPTKPKPHGSLSFVETSATLRAAPARASVRAAPPGSADFEMGGLNKTSTYLFELKNDGTAPITNVSLETDNPNVSISPASIGIIGTSTSGDMVPIIQVTVRHGLSSNGIGTAPLLPAGRLDFTLYATALGADATTHDPEANNDGVNTDFTTYGATHTSANASVGLTALVTEFTIKTGFDAPGFTSGVSLTNLNYETDPSVVPNLVLNLATDVENLVSTPMWSLAGGAFWNTTGVSSYAEEHRGVTTIANTGNTAITVDYLQPSDPTINPLPVYCVWNVYQSYSVAAGETLTIPDTDQQVAGNSYCDMLLRVRGSGAVFSATTLQPQANGSRWVFIHREAIVIPVGGG